MTFLGFLLLVFNFVMFSFYDFYFTESSVLPPWIWLVAAICQFCSHQLGSFGIDLSFTSDRFSLFQTGWTGNRRVERNLAVHWANCLIMAWIPGLVFSFPFVSSRFSPKTNTVSVPWPCTCCSGQSISRLLTPIGKSTTPKFSFFLGPTTSPCW